MTRPWMALLAAALATFAAPSGHATPSTAGSFTIRLGGLPPITLPANGLSNLVSDTLIVEAAGEFGPASVDLPDSLFTGVPQVSDLKIDALSKPLATATLSLGGALLLTPANTATGEPAGIGGELQLCVNSCLLIQVAMPLSLVGVGGRLFATALFQPLTVTAAGGWTTGQARITGINSELQRYAGHTCAPVTCGVMTLAAGTGLGVYVTAVTITGTNGLSPGGLGSVTLVTPVLTRSIAGTLPLFGIQTLVAAAEPGATWLTGSAVAGLLALCARRSRPPPA